MAMIDTEVFFACGFETDGTLAILLLEHEIVVGGGYVITKLELTPTATSWEFWISLYSRNTSPIFFSFPFGAASLNLYGTTLRTYPSPRLFINLGYHMFSRSLVCGSRSGGLFDGGNTTPLLFPVTQASLEDLDSAACLANTSCGCLVDLGQ